MVFRITSHLRIKWNDRELNLGPSECLARDSFPSFGRRSKLWEPSLTIPAFSTHKISCPVPFLLICCHRAASELYQVCSHHRSQGTSGAFRALVSLWSHLPRWAGLSKLPLVTFAALKTNINISNMKTEVSFSPVPCSILITCLQLGCRAAEKCHVCESWSHEGQKNK